MNHNLLIPFNRNKRSKSYGTSKGVCSLGIIGDISAWRQRVKELHFFYSFYLTEINI